MASTGTARGQCGRIARSWTYLGGGSAPRGARRDMATLQTWECFDADTGKDSVREIREYYIPDFRKWRAHDRYQLEFEKLLRDLKPPVPEVPLNTDAGIRR